MQKLYNSVYNTLSSISCEKYWKGFSQCTFALYDSENVYFQDKVIPVTKDFTGNRAIFYNNEYIAIWKVTNPRKEDPILLAASLVHIMFHAYQKTCKESRFTDDLKVLDYPDSINNFSLKLLENETLVKVIESADNKEKSQLLTKFSSIRKQRCNLMGNVINYEFLIESTDGLAEFIEAMALKDLSPDLFKKRLSYYKRKVCHIKKSFFNIRKISCYTGAVLLLALQSSDISYYHSIGTTKESIYSLVESHINPEGLIYENYINPDIEESLHDYQKYRKKTLNDFISCNLKEYDGTYNICGYDAMNMLKSGGYILNNTMIILRKNDDNKEITIEGPVLVKLKDGSYNEISAYYTME